MRELITKESGARVCNFINNHLDIEAKDNLFLSTSTLFNVENQPEGYFQNLINLKRLNSTRRINKFLEAVNHLLPDDGYFIGNAETYSLRKRKIYRKYPKGLNRIVYFLDFCIHRLMPKLRYSKKLYFFVTRGRYRVMSQAETFGRLYSCGFEIKEESYINGAVWFVAKKIKQPAYDYSPTYGPLIRLRRVGKRGKIIKVYKFRTMHAYSEYLQDYIFKHNDLQQGGKFANDFRVTSIGKVMRKFWLDEFPMFINILKGDMKLVGVRPLSNHYYSLYDKDLQERRIKYRPGLVPPFYVDMPKTLEEIMESERRYLDKYEKNPLFTDFQYFWKAFVNIVFKRARSK